MSHPPTQSNRTGDDPQSEEQSERSYLLKQRKPPLSDEAVYNLVGFIRSVQEGLADLRARGYTIQNGHVIPPDQNGDDRQP